MMMQVEDDVIRSDLEKIQPVPAIDTLATISPEQVDNVSSPPRTACSGTLLAYTNPTVTGELKILNKIIHNKLPSGGGDFGSPGMAAC